jgi:nucleotide-binding universal stress UspA family protein
MNTKRIVVGVDGSPGSDAALEWAIHQAESWGAEIVAVHVVQRSIPSGLAASVADPPRIESERWWSDLHVRVAEEFCRLLRNSRIAHRIVTVCRHPSTEILRVADHEDAGLVVVGNGLNSTMKEIFLGSVAHELSHHARRPLVIVPARGHDPTMDVVGSSHRRTVGETLVAHDHALSGVSRTMLMH